MLCRIAAKRAESAEFRATYDEARRLTDLARSQARLREEKGLTQRELAEQLNTSQQAISRLEHPDYQGHTLRTVARYAHALGARLEFRLVKE